MKNLLGRANSESAYFPTENRSPKNKQSLNLEDETDKYHKKARSPDKSKTISAHNDFNQRQKENPGGKVYIIIGGYPDLRNALESRGWIENPDPYSKQFNLKWALKKIDINYDQLSTNQLVNHFEKNTTVTTKVGLARNIRNNIWYQNDDIDEYFPKCYDLNDVAEFDDFVEEFKFSQAVAILKQSVDPKINTKLFAANSKLFKVKLCVALDICQRRIRPFDNLVEDLMRSEELFVNQEEWELLILQQDNGVLKSAKYERIIKSIQLRFGVELEKPTETIEEGVSLQVQLALKQFDAYNPQKDMNKGKNVWIVKPADLSRGRGIACHDDLANLLEHVKVRDCEWIAQKYIENPLVIKNKKLDIRQWVLVTDWAPLTIWFFDECYIRFTAGDYNPEDFNNKFSHLTNNSIAKHCEQFDMSEIEGNMWSCQEFSDHIKGETGQDHFFEKIQPQMKKMVIKSLQSVQDMMESRKNSFELFGYDFLIDDDFKPWLIEINSSPSMEYSTAITSRLVKAVLEDTVKVLVDYPKAKNKKACDTGFFKCIFSGKPVI
jgi:tubulin monoglycylase TTLL3/8